MLAQTDGWRLANCPDDDIQPPTAEEHEAMVAKYG